MKTTCVRLIFFVLMCTPLQASEDIIPLPPIPFQYSSERSDYDRDVVYPEKYYQGPIIDTHAHYDPGKIVRSDFGSFDPMLKDNNIKYAFVMPIPNEGVYLKEKRKSDDFGEYERKLLLEKNSRIRMLCSSNYITNWLHDSYHDGWYLSLNSRLERLQKDIDNQDCIGIGEISTYHFNKAPPNKNAQHVIAYPPNYKPFLDFIEVIAKNNVYLDLHMEPVTREGESYEDIYFSGIELLYQKYPDLKLILAHTGMTNVENAEKILNRYPNVMMSLKLIKKPTKRWLNIESINNDNYEVFKDWADLVEKMPNRFVIGTDAKFGRKGRKGFDRYEMLIVGFRGFLGALSQNAAELVAYKNAQRMYRLD